MTDSQRKDGEERRKGKGVVGCGDDFCPGHYAGFNDRRNAPQPPAASLDGREENECAICHATMLLRDGEEPTEMCDHCAHEEVARLQASRSSERERLGILAGLSDADVTKAANGELVLVPTDELASLRAAESRVEELQRELAKMKLKLRVTDAWAREERDGRIAAESQLSELTELLSRIAEHLKGSEPLHPFDDECQNCEPILAALRSHIEGK